MIACQLQFDNASCLVRHKDVYAFSDAAGQVKLSEREQVGFIALAAHLIYRLQLEQKLTEKYLMADQGSGKRKRAIQDYSQLLKAGAAIEENGQADLRHLSPLQMD